MSDLTELLERVKAATGPDRELDGDVWLAVISGATRRNVMAAWPDEDVIWEYHDPERNTMFRDNMIPRLSASIDAAVAIVERKMPGWVWQVRKSGYVELHHPTHHLKDEIGTAKTPPLSILAALLSALIAQGASS